MEVFMNIADRLKDLRKNAGYSQEQLAEMLEISRQAVSKWESAQGYPDIENVIRLSQIYHVSTDYILLGSKNETSPDDVLPEKSKVKREMHATTRKTLCIIAVIAATALITVLFIAGLDLIASFSY